jgi:hypothetical protein
LYLDGIYQRRYYRHSKVVAILGWGVWHDMFGWW